MNALADAGYLDDSDVKRFEEMLGFEDYMKDEEDTGREFFEKEKDLVRLIIKMLYTDNNDLSGEEMQRMLEHTENIE